jgi:hypothetical protein
VLLLVLARHAAAAVGCSMSMLVCSRGQHKATTAGAPHQPRALQTQHISMQHQTAASQACHQMWHTIPFQLQLPRQFVTLQATCSHLLLESPAPLQVLPQAHVMPACPVVVWVGMRVMRHSTCIVASVGPHLSEDCTSSSAAAVAAALQACSGCCFKSSCSAGSRDSLHSSTSCSTAAAFNSTKPPPFDTACYVTGWQQ